MGIHFAEGDAQSDPQSGQASGEAATALPSPPPRPRIKPKRDPNAALEPSAGDGMGANANSDRNITWSESVQDIHKRPNIRNKANDPHAKKGVLQRYHDWKTAHHFAGRYTIEKLLALEEYQEAVSPLRVFAVIVFSPLVGLVFIVLLAAIPLRSPLDGVGANSAFFVQSCLSYTLMAFALLLFIRRSLNIPDNVYSNRQALLISALTAGANEIFMIALSSLWTFPIPFRDLVGIPSFSTLLGVFHGLVLGTRLKRYTSVALRYLPLVTAQGSCLFIFQGIAIIFQKMPATVQAIIALLFPIIRALLKHWIWGFSGCLEDISTDVTLCVVEIFGSLFQNVCVQSASGPEIGAIIVLVDFAQAFLEARMYLQHKFIVDGRRTVSTASKIVQTALFPGALDSGKVAGLSMVDPGASVMRISNKGVSIMQWEEEIFEKPPPKKRLSRKRSSKIVASSEASSGGTMLDLGSIDPDVATSASTGDVSPHSSTQPMVPPLRSRAQPVLVDDVEIRHREHAKILTQTLQLMFSCEVLVFAEYSEFVSALVYGLYSLSLYHMPYAKYNLSFIGLAESDFWSSVANTTIYALLEGFTMLFLYTLVRAKYGLSTLYQLAFVLEKYWMSAQGKMLGSLSLVFILNTVHHGMDLSLEFNWEKILNGTAGT